MILMSLQMIPCPLDSLPKHPHRNTNFWKGKGIIKRIQYIDQFNVMVKWMKAIYDSLGFAPGARSWCYLFEQAGLITKGDFSKGEDFLTDHRKVCEENTFDLFIPLYLVAEDDSRGMEGYDFLNKELTPFEYMANQVKRLLDTRNDYFPHSFWKYQSWAPILVCEKGDIMNLCRKFFPQQVKSYSTKGWGDINSRANLVRLIHKYESMGVTPIVFLLYDHDPSGFNITETFRNNLRAVGEMMGWDGADDLRIERIGISQSMVDRYGFDKIHNLETSSGKDLLNPKHQHHKEDYVQNYLRLFGTWEGGKCVSCWKVESNILITNPQACKELMDETINSYLSQSGIESWRKDNKDSSYEVGLLYEQLAGMITWLFNNGIFGNQKLLQAQRDNNNNLNLIKGDTVMGSDQFRAITGRDLDEED
jgi:hypothetical protein